MGAWRLGGGSYWVTLMRSSSMPRSPLGEVTLRVALWTPALAKVCVAFWPVAVPPSLKVQL